jgi:hypothetical protein
MGQVKNFELEPDPVPGEVPERVVEELRNLRTRANDAVAQWREACKVQAEKYQLKPSALRKFVNALASDKVDALEAECADVTSLIESQRPTVVDDDAAA